ncbi:hypothetical protein ABZ355_45455, partial [Streptomyces sp. NPDC005989]
MSTNCHTGLPDPDAARRVIGESLTEVAGLLADEVQRHANAAPIVPYDLRFWFVCLSDTFPNIPGFMEGKAKNRHWKEIPLRIGEIALRLPRDEYVTGGEILRNIVHSEYWMGKKVPRTKRRACLSDLRLDLGGLTNILRAVAPPCLPPCKPPTFARLHDHPTVAPACLQDLYVELDEALTVWGEVEVAPLR